MDQNTDIGDDLENIGKAMRNLVSTERSDGDGQEESDLKRARRSINNLHQISLQSDSDDSFYAYILWAFLDDMWSNVAMVPSTYHHDEKILNLFENIGKGLEYMSRSFSSDERMDMHGFLRVFAEVYTDYIDWLDSGTKELNVSKIS